MTCHAVVSIGTNSTRLLIADVSQSPAAVMLARSTGTRIGEGLGDRGRLAQDAMRRTLDVVASYERDLAARDISRTYAIATSSLRRAKNDTAFSRKIAVVLGVPLEILSGEQEAIASYRGVRSAISASGTRLGVTDVGGGSTEFAVGVGPLPEKVASCEVGAVRLTEASPPLGGALGPVSMAVTEQARAIARPALGPIGQLGRVDRLALVGGSATTAAAILRGDDRRPAESEMSRGDLQRLIERLCALPLEARKTLPGMNPQRADILLAGLIVLDEIYALTQADRATIVQSDLLLGYLLLRRESDPPTA